MEFNLKKLLHSTLLIGTLGLALGAQSADDIYLGEPGYGGSGCPGNSASVTLSPDQKSLSILFDEYFVEAGRRKKVARKSCNIAVPVHVPQGFSVSVIEVDYRGYNSLPRGAQSRFSAEYFFAGKQGPKFVKTFRGSLDDEFMLESNLLATSMVWSPCGADVNLRVNTSMMVRTNGSGDDALATVDSADMRAGLIYQLKWKKCHSSSSYEDDYGYDQPSRNPPPRRTRNRRRF